MGLRAYPFYKPMTKEQIEGELKVGRDAVEIRYRWTEYAESDARAGMGVLFLSGFALSVALVLSSFRGGSRLRNLPAHARHMVGAESYEVAAESPRAARDLHRFNTGGAQGPSKLSRD